MPLYTEREAFAPSSEVSAYSVAEHYLTNLLFKIRLLLLLSMNERIIFPAVK